MGLTLKLSKSKAINPSTKKMGFRTTVKSNGKADMDSLVASASKNTTAHPAEIRMAFELVLDAIKDNLSAGKMVELKGIGTIGFSCSGAWTEKAEEQTAVEHKIGVTFFPSQEVHAAVATAKTSWTKDDEGDEPTQDGGGSSTGGTTTKPGESGNLDG
ncbi:MAG TPA: hypothetical protein DDZ04_09375 [Parabacteroides sp.]|nr:hypothetical protein [Parabacteroides sp.]